MIDYYDFRLAIDPSSGIVVPNARAQVYALSDTSFATPLAITDSSGVPIAQLVASPTGVFPQFKVASEEQQVFARTDSGIVTVLTSVLGMEQAALDAVAAYQTSAAASASAASSAAAAAAASAELAAAGGGGVANWDTMLGKPTTFPPSLHDHTAAQVSDATPIGRAVMKATTSQLARDAIGAGTGNGTSNLQLGTTGTTAAPGNHGHPASAIAFTPVGDVTATDVQSAIAQAAASGGGGGDSSIYVDILYSGGAYPAPAASYPSYKKILRWTGPVAPPSTLPPGMVGKQWLAMALT